MSGSSAGTSWHHLSHGTGCFVYAAHCCVAPSSRLTYVDKQEEVGYDDGRQRLESGSKMRLQRVVWEKLGVQERVIVHTLDDVQGTLGHRKGRTHGTITFCIALPNQVFQLPKLSKETKANCKKEIPSSGWHHDVACCVGTGS